MRRWGLGWKRSRVVVAVCCLALPGWLVGQQGKPVKPPAQRPAGTAPASEIPPHTAPKTGPKTAAVLPAYDGQNVAEVEVAGWPSLDPNSVLPKLALQPKHPFSTAEVTASVATLKAVLAKVPSPQGSRLSDVQTRVEPEVNGLRVTFILEPSEYFGIYEFPGALQFAYTRLLEAANYQGQEPYSRGDLSRAQTGLLHYFQQEGYFQARMTISLDSDTKHGLVNVLYHVVLGPRARFGTITLAGATPAETAHLQGVLGSFMARLRRSAVRPGKLYSFKTLQNATTYLQSALNGQKHLAAQVRLGTARYDRETNRAAITFEVDAGPVVNLRVVGMHIWPWNKRGLLPILQESRVDPELIQEGQTSLLNNLNSNGYFQAKVTVQTANVATTASQPGSGTVSSASNANLPESIVYTVVKGPRRDVEKASVSGNKFFTTADLQPQITVKTSGFLFLSHGDFSQELLRSSVSNIEAVYQNAGYSSVKVQPQVSYPGGNVVVNFKVTEGPQDFVDSLRFEGNTLAPAVLAPQGLQIGPGTPYTQKAVSQDRAQILAQYLRRGYLNASIRTTAQKRQGQPHLVEVVYNITEGPRVRTTSVVTIGRKLTQQRLIDQSTAANLRTGQPLTENDMLTAESELYEPGIFDWADVGPRRDITTQTAEDVIVKVHESRRNTLLYGFGFDLTNRGGSIPSGTVAVPGLPLVGLPSSFKTSQATFYGPSGNVEYTRLNLGGKAETLSAGAFAGRLDQRGSITFTNPNLLWSDFSGNLQLSAEHDSQNPIFTSREAQLSYQLERDLNKDKTTKMFLRYSFSETGLTRILIPALVPAQDLHTRLSTLVVDFIRDTRDNPLDAHKGILENLEFDYNPLFLGSSANFTKMVAQVAYYKQIPDKIIFANSVRLGSDHALGGSFIPLSQAFFSGGGSTLRGFPLDGAGPQRTVPACGNPAVSSTCSLLQVPVGGDALFILNSELRIPTPGIYSGLGVVLFYDGGNVFNHLGFSNLGASYTNTVGFGLRYATPVGPVRIDIGHNLNPLTGIKATQLFITLGQAF